MLILDLTGSGLFDNQEVIEGQILSIEESKTRLHVEELRNQLIQKFRKEEQEFLTIKTNFIWKLQILDYLNKNPKHFELYKEELNAPLK